MKFRVALLISTNSISFCDTGAMVLTAVISSPFSVLCTGNILVNIARKRHYRLILIVIDFYAQDCLILIFRFDKVFTVTVCFEPYEFCPPFSPCWKPLYHVSRYIAITSAKQSPLQVTVHSPYSAKSKFPRSQNCMKCNFARLAGAVHREACCCERSEQ